MLPPIPNDNALEARAGANSQGTGSDQDREAAENASIPPTPAAHLLAQEVRDDLSAQESHQPWREGTSTSSY